MKFKRIEILIGKEGLDKLKGSRVAVFGIGGVGGAVCEALIRGGIGAIDIIDNDIISETNLNRQAVAFTSTIGKLKTEVMKSILNDINPDARIYTHNVFYSKETEDEFDFSDYSYIVDAIDTVTSKLIIIENAKKKGVPVISSMGTGNKTEPTMFEIADISETSVCPLARVMRKELKDRGICGVKVLYSKEKPLTPADSGEESAKRQLPGSMSFVPPAAGMIIAGEVIKDLLRGNCTNCR